MTDRETIGVYDRRTQDYVAFSDEGRRDPHLHDFIAAMPKGGHALDLGCGPGHAAAEMAAAGLRVTATDASAAMVAEASQHPGDIEVRQASFNEIEGEAIYDGVWANFSLLHAPRADMPRHLAALVKALKPGGVFFIGMKRGTGSKRDDIGRYYTFYTQDELEGLLHDAGLTVTGRRLGAGKGLDGTVSEWISVAAHG